MRQACLQIFGIPEYARYIRAPRQFAPLISLRFKTSSEARRAVDVSAVSAKAV